MKIAFLILSLLISVSALAQVQTNIVYSTNYSTVNLTVNLNSALCGNGVPYMTTNTQLSSPQISPLFSLFDYSGAAMDATNSPSFTRFNTNVVTKIIAGSNVTLSSTTNTSGISVTVNSSGSGSGITSLVATNASVPSVDSTGTIGVVPTNFLALAVWNSFVSGAPFLTLSSYQVGSANLNNWSQLTTNIFSALPYQIGSQNLTNWSQLTTGSMASASQLTSATNTQWTSTTNLVNAATNALGTAAFVSTNYFQFATNFFSRNTAFVDAGFGSDANNGDVNHPWATTTNADKLAPSGWQIAVAPGTYNIVAVTNGTHSWYLASGARVWFNNIHNASNFSIQGDGWVDWFSTAGGGVALSFSNVVAIITCNTFNEWSTNSAGATYVSESAFADGTNRFNIHCKTAQLSMVDNFSSSTNYFYVKADEVYESNFPISGGQRHDIFCNNVYFDDLASGDPAEWSKDSRIYAEHGSNIGEDNGMGSGSPIDFIWGISFYDNSDAYSFQFSSQTMFAGFPTLYDPFGVLVFNGVITPCLKLP